MSNLNFLRRHSVFIILSHDIFAVILSWWVAFFVCYNFDATTLRVLEHGFKAQLLVAFVHTIFYWRYKTYRPLWRFFSLPELMRLAKAILCAWIVNITILFLAHDLILIPKSIWFIYPLWLILILGLSRSAIRYFSDKQTIAQQIKRVLVVGAGRGAELFLRELDRLPERQYQPVVSLDDNPALKSKEIRGVPIVGSIAQLPGVVKKEKIDLVVVAIPSIKTITLQHIVKLCEENQVSVRLLPSLAEFEAGQPSSLQPRDVSLEDLLGRDPIELDWQGVKNFLHDQVVLVSGGGGSIGSELCYQILQMNPKKLVIVDHSEFNLYQVEQALSNVEAKKIFIELISVVDVDALEYVMKKHRPTIVFHAAAYKHVPILEFQIVQAVKNNVVGTKIMAELAIKYHVKKFVLVSSDKAVNPANVMGATKRIAEIFCQACNQISNTAFITVRFGNVIGSTGSVIPLFKKQIAQGGPVTVTHPDMTRYFMTIQEASQLILQAGAQGMGGEIFVLDMGQPVKILDLAKHLIQLSGNSFSTIKIIYTGLRPGEKLFEELFYEKEELIKTQQKKIFKANGDIRKNWSEIQKIFGLFELGFLEYDESFLIQAMKQLLENEGIFLEKNSRMEYDNFKFSENSVDIYV